MKKYVIIKKAEEDELQSCTCGGFPVFIIPNDKYTDCWLQCNRCGRATVNTGGYHYAREISLQEAKRKAIEIWNRNVTSQ